MQLDANPAVVSKNDEFCIKNEEFCIKNEEFCITNEELCIRNDEFFQAALLNLATDCHTNLGVSYERLDQLPEAEAQFLAALGAISVE